MVGLPYGRAYAKISTHEKEEIPNTLRQYKNSEIYRLYQRYLRESNMEMNYELPRSTVFKLLNVLSATYRRSLKCVDNFVVDGAEVR